MAENTYSNEGLQAEHGAQTHANRVEIAQRNEGAYRASRETRSKSWHWIDMVSTFVPVAIAGLFLLLMLFWVIRLFVL